MAQANSLSEIIRPATEHANPTIGYQELVAIDTRTGQAVTNRGIIDSLMGNFRYFLVSNNRDPKKIISGTKQVRYKEGHGEVLFSIEYKGGCPAGKEWWAAQCFFKTPISEDAIRDRLAAWFMEFFSSAGRTIDDFYSEAAKASIELVTKAGQNFGLELNIELKVDASALETIELGPVVIASRLRDLDEEKTIWFKAELGVDENLKLRALLHQKTPLTDVLVKGVRRFFANSVSLDTFCDDVNGEQIKRELSSYLNNLLKPFGRQAVFLSLKPDGDDCPKTFKGETEIQFIHHEYPDPIKIKVSALMIPKDRARYISSGSPVLKDWLDRNLPEVMNETLFGISYVNLLLDFAELKKKIDAVVNARASRIGYQVTQLMTVLYLEPFEWLKRIDIEVKSGSATNGQSSEAMFETSLSGFYVGMEVFLTARIRDLRGIESYLITKQNVPQRMKEEIIRLVQKTMHETDPDRFYRFSEPDQVTYPNQKPFEQEIREKIQSLVDSDFNGEVIHIVLKQMETAFDRKLDLISKTSHEFSANAELGQAPGAAGIVVKGSFKVLGIRAERDGWRTFKDCDVSPAVIQKRIEDSIRASVKGEPDDHSLFAEVNGLDHLVNRALIAARETISEEFGIEINLSTVYWDWDDGLKRLGLSQSKENIGAVQERLSRLRDELLSCIEADAGDEIIQDIEERIRRLSTTLPPALASGVGIRRLDQVPAPRNLPAPDLDKD
jgi:hypothetical protein